MIVSVEWILFLKAELAKINNWRLEDITFTEEGIKLDIPTPRLEVWELTGLTNVDFITSNAYKGA
ncbi:MAG: hypothetical protein ACW99G_04800 [Candidatus Thorarchaeota archaeon]|jgi:hypothetical protein